MYNLLEKIFANKWVVWADAVFVTLGASWVGTKIITDGFLPLWTGIVSLLIIPPFLAVVWSLKGEISGWE